MKKGFTMIEVLAVFTTTALILLIAVPYVINLLTSGSSEARKNFENDVFIAAEAYVNDTEINNNLYITQETSVVTIKSLIESGYLKGTLVNPDNKKEMTKTPNIDGKVEINKDNEGVLQYKIVIGNKNENN